MDMNLTGSARYRRLAWGLAVAGALALLSLALIGGLFGWLMDTVASLGSARAQQASAALPLMTALVVALGLLLRWRLSSSRKNKHHADKRPDIGF
ncbi:hypothetical protein [Kinneretia aquatilis]|jgi:hypothetical protein|uniref:hypothetical protein n=1 Tax=Kinneretia aquatilis TaxID=2070761 RepID=UPI00149520EA|nr:hypothetical protein [Paucibacter aquatile]WIV96110.1 hypothetical protein K9V56_013760 [Paucibacter aquatile]